MVFRLCLAARPGAKTVAVVAAVLSVVSAANHASAAADLQLRQRMNRATVTRSTHENVSVIISGDEATTEQALRDAGIVAQRLGDHWVARGPIGQWAQLGNQFERLSLAPALRPLLDRSLIETKAIDVHRGNGVKARNGNGVLIGVLDTGIDLTHPAFLDRNGNSRVVAVWDQDGEGNGPTGYGFGRVCDQQQIAAGACNLTDRVGHGTHVAGILAGAMAPHTGIATGAQLVVVQSSQFTDVAAAVDWMFRVAREQGKPMVINLSLGGHLGAHDGQSELEKVLERLQGPGRIIVTAAGNDGASALHARLPASPTLEQRVEIEMPSGGLPVEVYADIWQAKNRNNTFALEVTDRAGTLLTRYALDDSAGAGHEDTLLVDGISHGRFTFATEFVKANNKLHHLLIMDRTDLNPGFDDERWFLVTRGDDFVDAWLTGSDYSFANPVFHTLNDLNMPGFVPGDLNSTLTIPGTAKGVITVGSYVTKNEWASQRGKTFQLSNTSLNSISSFSSAGPTASPELTGDKPDLVAPGQLIAGPRSHGASSISSALAIDDNFAIMQGTSMSAPHVAGAVALLLEARPSLTPDEAKALLKESATASLPEATHQRGAGLLNIQAAVAKLEGTKAKGCSSGSDNAGIFGAVAMVILMLRRRRNIH